MKAFLATILMFVLGDYAINHGHATHEAVRMTSEFCSWIAASGRDSVFTH